MSLIADIAEKVRPKAVPPDDSPVGRARAALSAAERELATYEMADRMERERLTAAVQEAMAEEQRVYGRYSTAGRPGSSLEERRAARDRTGALRAELAALSGVPEPVRAAVEQARAALALAEQEARRAAGTPKSVPEAVHAYEAATRALGDAEGEHSARHARLGDEIRAAHEAVQRLARSGPGGSTEAEREAAKGRLASLRAEAAAVEPVPDSLRRAVEVARYELARALHHAGVPVAVRGRRVYRNATTVEPDRSPVTYSGSPLQLMTRPGSQLDIRYAVEVIDAFIVED